MQELITWTADTEPTPYIEWSIPRVKKQQYIDLVERLALKACPPSIKTISIRSVCFQLTSVYDTGSKFKYIGLLFTKAVNALITLLWSTVTTMAKTEPHTFTCIYGKGRKDIPRSTAKSG